MSDFNHPGNNLSELHFLENSIKVKFTRSFGNKIFICLDPRDGGVMGSQLFIRV